MHPYDGLDLTPHVEYDGDWEALGKARVEGCKEVGIDPEAFDLTKGAIGFAFDPSTLNNVRNGFIYHAVGRIKEMFPYYDDIGDSYLAAELASANICLLHARLWAYAVGRCYSTHPVPLNILLIDRHGTVWHTQFNGKSVPEHSMRIFVSQAVVRSYLYASGFAGDRQCAGWDDDHAESVKQQLAHMSQLVLPPQTPRHSFLESFFVIESNLHKHAFKPCPPLKKT